MWLAFILLSVFFFSMIVILAKYGITRTDATLGATIWIFVLFFICAIPVLQNNLWRNIPIYQTKTMVLLLISSVSLCFFIWFEFLALSSGAVNKVIPVNGLYIIIQFLIEKFAYHQAYEIKIIVIYAVYAIGILCMLFPLEETKSRKGNLYLAYALLATIFLTIWQRILNFGLLQIMTPVRYVSETGIAFFVLLLILFVKRGQKHIYSISLISGIALCLSAGCLWIAQYFLSKAIVSANTFYISEIKKLNMFFMVALACIFFREKLPPKSFFGIVLLTCAYCFLR